MFYRVIQQFKKKIVKNLPFLLSSINDNIKDKLREDEVFMAVRSIFIYCY